MAEAQPEHIAAWIDAAPDDVRRILRAACISAERNVHVRAATGGLPAAREGLVSLGEIEAETGLDAELIKRTMMAALLAHRFHAAGRPRSTTTGETLAPLDLNLSIRDVEERRAAGEYGDPNAVSTEVVILKHLGWMED